MELDFFTLSESLYKQRYQAGEISYHTLSGALSMLGDFRLFCTQAAPWNPLRPEHITQDLLHRYKLYCVEKGNKPVTVNRKLTPLLLSLKKAGVSGLESVYFPMRTRRYGQEAGQIFPDENERTHHLSDAQLRRLLRFGRESKKEAVRKSLQLFFFSFHACGLRVSDIITLEWRNIDFRKARLSKISVKTKSPITIPLSAPAMAILQCYKGIHERFVFGLLPDDMVLNDDATLARAIDYRNRSLRMTLNRIGRELGFPFPLGMHVARHTFAVKALNATKLNVHMISRLLGHASVLVTEKVYARYLLPTLAEEVRKRITFSEFATDSL